jgi:hypothetical protein
MRPVKSLFLALIALSICSIPAFADTFKDSTFNLANYTGINYRSDPAISISSSQCATCGTSASKALHILTTYPAETNLLLMEGFINTTFTYNPSLQGVISSISSSVDKYYIFRSGGTFTSNFFRPMILQDGNYYMAAIPVSVTPGVYNNGSASGLLATDFQLFDFLTGAFNSSSHPNFSGDTMEFGLANRITNTFTTADGNITNYDNYSLTVASVPEPSALLLMAFGLVALICVSGSLRRCLN